MRAGALDRLTRGVPLIRQDVDLPDPHLVSYLAVTDGARLLLCAHRKAGLWLPFGGHVEPAETPLHTAKRECIEELGLALDFVTDVPVFVTLQQTTGPRQHHDLSLWYLLRAAPDAQFDWDAGEFEAIRWFLPEHIPQNQAEPQLPRFVDKMRRLGHLSAALEST